MDEHNPDEKTARATAALHHGLEPGDYVRHPAAPDWGLGQVQSVVGANVTVNFEECGKVMINTAVVDLVAASAGDDA
jgi:hypothetical protein